MIDKELLVHECLGDKTVVDIMYDTRGGYYMCKRVIIGIAGFPQPDCSNQTEHPMKTTLPKVW
jgi:hypothetical protein